MQRDKHIQQFAVVGLGQFGLAVARCLYDRGHEVLGIDRREEPVQHAMAVLPQGVQA